MERLSEHHGDFEAAPSAGGGDGGPPRPCGHLTIYDNGKASYSGVVPPPRKHIKVNDEVFFFPDEPLREGYEVFKGEIRNDLHIIEKVAVKLITVDGSAGSKYLREMRNMLELSRHPNVALYKRSGNVPRGNVSPLHRYVYIAMDLCQEKHLGEFLGKNCTFHFRQALMLQICHGMNYIHGKNIAHRDLKPSNVLLSLDGKNAVISDFGLSKEVKKDKSTISESSGYCGTLGWTAAEIHGDGKPVTLDEWIKADVFSFGILAVHILTSGCHPFEGDEAFERQASIKAKKLPQLQMLSKSGHPDWGTKLHLLEMMLDHDPCKRPTALQVLEHPFFWESHKKLNFFKCTLNLLPKDQEAGTVVGTVVYSHLSRDLPIALKALEDLKKEEDASPESIVEYEKEINILKQNAASVDCEDWRKALKSTIFSNQSGKRMEDEQAYGNCLKELARFIRNRREHSHELQESALKKVACNDDSYFCHISRIFPKFFIHWFINLRDTAATDANGRQLLEEIKSRTDLPRMDENDAPGEEEGYEMLHSQEAGRGAESPPPESPLHRTDENYIRNKLSFSDLHSSSVKAKTRFHSQASHSSP